MPYESRAMRCNDGELDEIIEFATEVFNVDFPGLLPRLYRKGATTGHDHFAVREEGKLAAAVISFPLDLTVAGHTFATNGVGTVSVAEECRGRGYMTDLLASCLNDAKERGAAISVLGGQRQRYGYYGYARVGEHVSFAVTRSSVRHTIGLRESAYTFREASAADADALVRMMQTRPVYAERSADDFLFAAAADFRKTYIISDNSADIGYFVARPELTHVSELVLADGASVDETILSILAKVEDRVDVDAPAHEARIFSRLYYLADDWHASSFSNFAVLDLPTVIEAFGELVCRCRAIGDGRFVLGVKAHPFFEKIGVAEQGRNHGNFGISVEGGRVSVQPVDAGADVELSYIDALEFLFTRIGDTVEYLPPVCRTLLPLPIFFPPADKV